MNYVPFGATSQQVSEMCLGTMMFGDRCDQAESDRILATALDHGVNFVDTAAMYVNGRTEEILGHILQGRREKLFVATKVNSIDTIVERNLLCLSEYQRNYCLVNDCCTAAIGECPLGARERT